MFQRDRPLDLDCRTEDKMEFDEACLQISNRLDEKITMMKIFEECYKCNMKTWKTINAQSTEYLAVFIDNTYKFMFTSANGSSCTITYSFQQHGTYEWTADFGCRQVKEVVPPENPYLPLYIAFGIIVIISIFYQLWKFSKKFKIHKKFLNKFGGNKEKDQFSETEHSEATTGTVYLSADESEVFPLPRIIAIQVFRGVTILLMIITHGECNRYWFLHHANWNGIMPSDFMHPWFLWSMGSFFYFRYKSELMSNIPRPKVIFEILLRSLRYILLGFVLNTFENNNMKYARIPGELQRYGLLHLIMFTVEVARMKKYIEENIWKKLSGYLNCWVQGLFTLVCVVVNLLLTYLLPVPSCPTGYTGPGGEHMEAKYALCTGGAAGYLDRLVFGENHLSFFPESKDIYSNTLPFDSYGILGTLNCTLTVFSGIQAARVFVYYSTVKLRSIILGSWGITQIVLGLCLCGFMKEEGPIPLNASLWSLSFALLTSGTAFLVLLVIYVLVDVKEWWSGSPCFQAGVNLMLLYFGHIVLRYSMPFSWTPPTLRSYRPYVIMDVITLSFWVYVSLLAFKHSRIFMI